MNHFMNGFAGELTKTAMPLKHMKRLLHDAGIFAAPGATAGAVAGGAYGAAKEKSAKGALKGALGGAALGGALSIPAGVVGIMGGLGASSAMAKRRLKQAMKVVPQKSGESGKTYLKRLHKEAPSSHPHYSRSTGGPGMAQSGSTKGRRPPSEIIGGLGGYAAGAVGGGLGGAALATKKKKDK